MVKAYSTVRRVGIKTEEDGSEKEGRSYKKEQKSIKFYGIAFLLILELNEVLFE